MRQRKRKDGTASSATRGIAWVLVAEVVVSAGCAAASSATNPASPAAPPTPAIPTSAQAGGTTIVAVAPPAAPCCKKQTLPEFLGIPQFGQAVIGAGNQVCSRLRRMLGIEGMFPELQAKPPILPITDPANMSEDAPPVVKAAAEAKQEEDQAAQKVQALRYLARIGCGGCYPNIEDALLSALDDCTEEVRYEAVLALRGKSGTQCTYCKSDRCCSEKVRKKLEEIANKTDDKGCHVEPSGRVRRLARMALDACGGAPGPQAAPATPTEGPDGSLPISGPTPAGIAQRDRASGTQSVRAAAHDSLSDGSLDDEHSPAPLGLFEGVEWIAVLTGEAAGESEAATDEGVVPVSATNDSVLAWVDRTAIRDSQISRLVEQRVARLKSQGIQLDPDAARRLMMSETYRAIDLQLLLSEMRKDQGAARGKPTREEIAQLPQWLAERLDVDTYVSMFELTRYYESQRERFLTPPQLRWERITVAKKMFAERDDARTVMTYLRSRALGKEVARPLFDRRAVETETHDWTKLEDMASPQLGRVLFQMPVGVMSSIIEDEEFLHTVRVLEKHSAGTIAFDEVADTLRREIVAKRKSEAERLFVAQLRADARIWTVYDDESAAARPSADRPSVERTSVELPAGRSTDRLPTWPVAPTSDQGRVIPGVGARPIARQVNVRDHQASAAVAAPRGASPTVDLPPISSPAANPSAAAMPSVASPSSSQFASPVPRLPVARLGGTAPAASGRPLISSNGGARPVRDLVTNLHGAARGTIRDGLSSWDSRRPASIPATRDVSSPGATPSETAIEPHAPNGADAPFAPVAPASFLIPLPPVDSANGGDDVAESGRREAQ